MNPHDRFHDLVKKQLAPLLRADGFKGSGNDFRRVNGDAIHVLSLQGHLGRCCVNLGVHFSFLPTAGGRRVTDPKKLKEYECAFRERLHEKNKSDHWWDYGNTEAEADASLRSLMDIYRQFGRAYFQLFEPFPEVFDKVVPVNADGKILIGFPVRMLAAEAAATMARIMKHLGNSEKCRQFAEVGLRHIDRLPHLKSALEKLRKHGK